MTLETQWVQQQIIGFANGIFAKGIDALVVLVAETPAGSDLGAMVPACDGAKENPICVPPPLASPGCADRLTPPAPFYDSVNCHVDSHNAFQQILDTYPVYQPSLRSSARKHVVVISDDDSNLSASQFDTTFRGLDSTHEDYIFHAIVGFTEPDIGTPCWAITGNISAHEGKAYRQLVQMRGGVEGDLCLQNFQPVWDAVSQQVVASSKIACEWDIPDPGMGQTIDPGHVNVDYVGGGATTPLGYVSGAAECTTHQNAWYYDDASNPTKIIACPDTCSLVQSAQAVSVTVKFGCATVPAIPK
jgi:hypothetical protein